jgi:outer membrane lipoprotein-sorting protein
MIGHSCTTLEKMPYIRTMLNNRTISNGAPAVGSCLALVVALSLILPSRAQDQQVPKTPNLPPDGAEAAPVLPATPAPPAAAPGVAPAPAPEEPPTEVDRFVDEAIKKIAKLQFVSAELEQDVDMLAQKFKITGRYLKAPNARVYLLLKVAGLPDSAGSSLQVCDGETLWEYLLILENKSYRKRSVKPILERLNSPELDPELRNRAVTQMGLAGPETLLAGLRKSIRFDLKVETVLGDRKVWKLHGAWKNRQGLIGLDSRPVSPTGVLPPYIPMDATLYLGKEDSWPYKVLLEGRPLTAVYDLRRTGPDGRPIGAKRSIEKVPRSIVTLSYSDVKLNVPIKADDFYFEPPTNATVEDDTEQILKGLDRALEIEAQRKKAEAARKEGEVLDQPIDVPKTPEESKPRG